MLGSFGDCPPDVNAGENASRWDDNWSQGPFLLRPPQPVHQHLPRRVSVYSKCFFFVCLFYTNWMLTPTAFQIQIWASPGLHLTCALPEHIRIHRIGQAIATDFLNRFDSNAQGLCSVQFNSVYVSQIPQYVTSGFTSYGFAFVQPFSLSLSFQSAFRPGLLSYVGSLHLRTSLVVQSSEIRLRESSLVRPQQNCQQRLVKSRSVWINQPYPRSPLLSRNLYLGQHFGWKCIFAEQIKYDC